MRGKPTLPTRREFEVRPPNIHYPILPYYLPCTLPYLYFILHHTATSLFLCFLGDWEKEVQVGYVRERVYPEHFTAQHRKKEEPEALDFYLFELWVGDVKTNEPFLPHWSFCQVVKELHGGVVPPTWENVKRLPWREIQSIPLRIHEACYSDTFPNDDQRTFDDNFMGTGVKARVRVRILSLPL